MGRLVAGELIKVRTTRTALGFAAASLLLVLASVLITILAGHPDTIEDKRAALDEQSEAEDTRWRKVREPLETALRRARS